MRQYFNLITRAREVAEGLREDAGLLSDSGRALLGLPGDRRSPEELHPFGRSEPFSAGDLAVKRVAIVATGGSGALASVVGVTRAMEEAGVVPAVISVCSGSAMFGFPIAAGVPTDEVAEFAIGLRPQDYIDPDWHQLARVAPTAGRGFAGVIAGEAIEASYRRLLGDMTLGEMPIPAYAPIWNIEHNRLEYLGPRTFPDLPVARAVHLAVALPLFLSPVELDELYWCDGGIVDIFPVRPVLEIEDSCDVAVAVNGFYPPEFTGEDATGWENRAGSILYVASQVRTCQQVQLARENLSRLRDAMEVVTVEPVPYRKVRGAGFYRQFLSTRDWPGFMRAGRRETRRALEERKYAGRDLASGDVTG